ncbi:hypothetical protein K402DRAFT_410866 [Aulographum hederae CBS 113979]|uniref:TPR-like protein n=1 Tax=Aulographum hederae CBS 113979 TaxID=1176131 RepID=A0A6G1H9B9_9PEZI|nr:hypothetical protein K402DRAFT_410866 [Aulographum hederae CBS 113979]
MRRLYHDKVVYPYRTFPEEVSTPLRRALFFTYQWSNPERAMKYMLEAMQAVKDTGMDPYSDEVINMRVQIAVIYQNARQDAYAIRELETLRREIMDLVGKNWDSLVQDGRRAILLKWAVGLSVKLGELWGQPQMEDKQGRGEEYFTWAVETALKEKKRREDEGVLDGEGDWMGEEEIGATMEGLANLYLESKQSYLATPLFLRAYSVCPPTSCHKAVLMNNLSTSILQQRVPDSHRTPNMPAPSPSETIAQSLSWAKGAIAAANAVEAPHRDVECDSACAVATYNIGELAELTGDVEAAKKKYQEAEAMFQGLKSQIGQNKCSGALQRLEDAEAKKKAKGKKR